MMRKSKIVLLSGIALFFILVGVMAVFFILMILHNAGSSSPIPA